jgi:GMP synthase-like glutamine amidotransferase
MRIGVVKVSTKHYVEKAVEKLGHTPVVYQINDPDLFRKIKESPIQKWIFTGSSLRLTVLNPLAPQVPMDVFHLKDKQFFMICYSMESVLFQLGYPVVKRKTHKKERFQLGPLTAYRNHWYYIPCNAMDSKVKVTECYNGEVMTGYYKNAVLTQWHPERTQDGIECLKAWIAC